MDKRKTEAEADDDAELDRLVGDAMRRWVEEMDPDLYHVLAEKYPAKYGPDALSRIKAEFPQLFRDPTPKG